MNEPGADRYGEGGFAARVAAAVARTGPLCAGIDPSPELLSRLGPERRRARTSSVRTALRGGVRRSGAGGQAPGGVLRALRFSRGGGPRGVAGRGPVFRSPGHRRRQAGGHREHHGGLRPGVARPRQPAVCRRRHRGAVPGVGRPPAHDRSGRGQRPGRAGGGPELQSRGPVPAAGPDRRGDRVRPSRTFCWRASPSSTATDASRRGRWARWWEPPWVPPNSAWPTWAG